VPTLTESEFKRFQKLMFDEAGVTLPSSKKALVSGRLAKRLKLHGCGSFGAYYDLLSTDASEHQWAVDLLTTNETYFFREPKHFEFLRDEILKAHPSSRPFRAWSAASSSGEEPYSLAMLLGDVLGSNTWEVIGSDISMQVLEKAERGLYPLARTNHMPPGYLKRFCLKGTGTHAGKLLVSRNLRERVKFMQVNLNAELPKLGQFDVIFLRNVMIYFSAETKAQVVRRVLAQLRPGGHFFIGHSESLNGITDGLELVRPSVYRKPA
tara:strand:+ start:3064 stop:3861 length:798 start_codon:yes stop_codon:yes gene_type:complete